MIGDLFFRNSWTSLTKWVDKPSPQKAHWNDSVTQGDQCFGSRVTLHQWKHLKLEQRRLGLEKNPEEVGFNLYPIYPMFNPKFKGNFGTNYLFVRVGWNHRLVSQSASSKKSWGFRRQTLTDARFPSIKGSLENAYLGKFASNRPK